MENTVRLLADELQTREFVRTFLAPFGKVRLFQVVARRKYATEESQQLSRGQYIVEPSIVMDFSIRVKGEEKIFRELRKAEVLASAGLYKDEKGNSIPIELMVAYVTAYPLDEDEACDGFISHVMERRKQAMRTLKNGKGDPTEPIVKRPDLLIRTCLHKSPCRKVKLLKLDVDTKDPELLKKLYHVLCGTVVVVAAETRGGYHVIIERGKACQELFLYARDVNKGVDDSDKWITIENGDGPLFAIPGTNQGGFTVRLATEEWQAAIKEADSSK